ncbi:MAG: phosphomannomutase/phosphoglucomutase [Deltaproteobacteria bacterium]|nr:phosphomannomutase/phosphoglucomutase [Deltaproteobacteria bacterium]
MNSHVFREYDIRGVAARDLTSDLAYRIGQGLGTLLRPEGPEQGRFTVAVARDCRESGPRLLGELTRGLVDAGADVIDCGVGPTPLLYFAAHHLGTGGAVMVTGSHNPGDENGFKILRGKGSFFGEDLQALRRWVEGGAAPPDRGRGSVREEAVEDAYVARLTAGLSLGAAPPRVVIDAGNGAAGPLALRALRALGVEPVALYCDMDGTFPNHHPDPTVPANLETLIATVRRERAAVGLAFDGDGDRLGVVDATGEILWGDRLLALFARDVLRASPGAMVLGEVKCSETLFADVARHGGRPLMWKTGHSLIKTKMRETGALLAGEMSGHFFFADRYPGYDDGIYAGLRLLEILAREGRTAGALLEDLPHPVSTPELRVRCPDSDKQRVVARVRERLHGRGELVDIDGVRVKYADGAWALVRASNTGPILVLRFEAPSEARLREVRTEVFAALVEAGLDVGPSAAAHG